MTSPVYRLIVRGSPKPKGSMKCVGQRGPTKHVLIEDDKTGDGKRWRAQLTAAAQVLAHRIGQPLDVAIAAGVLFIVPRPKSAARRDLPTTRSSHDVDKLLRMAFDALADAGVLADDSRVVGSITTKTYERDDLPPGAIVYVAPKRPDEPGAAMERIVRAILSTAPELRF